MSDPVNRKPQHWEWATFGLVLLTGAWVRMRSLDQGTTSDELSFLRWRGVDWIFKDSLNRVHPPFFRMSVSAFFEPEQALLVGRCMALTAGLLSIGVVWALTRRATNSRIAALCGAAAFAALPTHIAFSTMFRPYTTLALLMAAHLLALGHWVDNEGRGRAGLWVGLTALLMPQVHYIAVPWLALTGLGVVSLTPLRWIKLAVYLPAGLAMLPLFESIFGNLSAQSSAGADTMQSFEHLFGMGLNASKQAPFLSQMWPISLTALVLTTLLWRFICRQQQVLVLGGIAMCLTVLWVAGKHHLAPSTQMLGAPFLIPLVVSLPWVLVHRSPFLAPIAPAVFVAIVGNITVLLHARLTYELSHSKSHDRLQLFLSQYSTTTPKGHDIRFKKPTDVDLARFALTQSLQTNNDTESGCPDSRCFQYDGRFWLAGFKDKGHRPSVWVSPRRQFSDPLPEGCTAMEGSSLMPALAVCTAHPNSP
jgi:hypothetical protein